jgi:hypothetical protein
MRDGVLKRSYMRAASSLDYHRGWDRLPKPLALLTLVGLRMVLRRKNLFDTGDEAVGWGPELPSPGPRRLTRSSDGTGTDPIYPGLVATDFGLTKVQQDTLFLNGVRAATAFVLAKAEAGGVPRSRT